MAPPRAVARSARMGALAAYEQLLVDLVRVLGADHPDALTTRSNVAGWRGESGDVAGALAALEELVIDQARVLGVDHPDALATRDNLASWRGRSGDVAGALAAFDELVVDQVRVLVTVTRDGGEWRVSRMDAF